MEIVAFYLLLTAGFILFCGIEGQIPDDTEACNDADILEDAYRYYNNTDATGNCDIHRNEGWVRFKYNGLNAEIPTVCIKNQACGTRLPMRIDMEGKSTPAINKTVWVSACSSYNILGQWDCCVLRQRVGIRNCGDFYVYHLLPTDRCPVSYCTQVREDNPSHEFTLKKGDPVVQQPSPSVKATNTSFTATFPTSTEAMSSYTAGSITSSISKVFASSDFDTSTLEFSMTTVDTVSASSAGVSEVLIAPEDNVGNDTISPTEILHLPTAVVSPSESSMETSSSVCWAIGTNHECDNYPDCSDESDEANCEITIICSEGMHKCPDGRTCSVHCDGFRHCADGSDEANCDADMDVLAPLSSVSNVSASVPEVTDRSTHSTVTQALKASTVSVSDLSESGVKFISLSTSTLSSSYISNYISVSLSSNITERSSVIDGSPVMNQSSEVDSTDISTLVDYNVSSDIAGDTRMSNTQSFDHGSALKTSTVLSSDSDLIKSDSSIINVTLPIKSSSVYGQTSLVSLSSNVQSYTAFVVSSRTSLIRPVSSTPALTILSSSSSGPESTARSKFSAKTHLPSRATYTSLDEMVSAEKESSIFSSAVLLPNDQYFETSFYSLLFSNETEDDSLDTSHALQTSDFADFILSSSERDILTFEQTHAVSTSQSSSTNIAFDKYPSSSTVSNTVRNGTAILATTDDSSDYNGTDGEVDVFETETVGNVFDANKGLFIFLIVFVALVVGLFLFGLIGTIYQHRMRTWHPRKAYEDAYADMEKSKLSFKKKKKGTGVENPIPDIDILSEEQTQETSLSRASTMVLGAPSPIQGHTAFKSSVSTFKQVESKGTDTQQGENATSNAQNSADGGFAIQNGVTNHAVLEDKTDTDGIVPVDEIDTSGPRAFFPWIEQAEDTKL